MVSHPQHAADLATWSDKFITSRIDLDKNTTRNYKTALKKVGETFGDRDPATITVDEVAGWVATLAETMKPGTIQLYLLTFRMLIDYCDVDPNPARDPRVKLPKRVREEPTPPPAEHVLAILNEIHDPLRRIMFITLEQGALRLGEAVHLRWGDVDRAGLRLRLPRSATKRDQARWVYLPEWLMEAIEAPARSRIACPTAGCSAGSPRRPRTRRCSAPARSPASRTTTRTI
jgi:integrase